MRLTIEISLNSSFSQLSKTHYIPPLTSGPSNADPLDQYFYISTPINGDVTFKIKPVGFPDQEVSYIVNNANPKRVTIASAGYSQLFQDIFVWLNHLLLL